MLDYLRKTDSDVEMIEIAHKIVAEKSDLYTPIMMEKMKKGVEKRLPDISEEEKERIIYKAIYDWWVFGAHIDEVIYYGLYEKTSKEKEEYMLENMRIRYINHLNSGGGKEMRQLLQDKYMLYKKLEPYYKRDVIEIHSMDDFDIFSQFVAKHPIFVIKPADFYYGIGVHKANLVEYGNDVKVAMESILNEGLDIKSKNPLRESKMVLEEVIEQDERLTALHCESVNAVRATAVRGKDGKIHIFHPWIKCGINGGFVASAALNGFDAEIDSETGIVISDGYQENGNIYKVHPNSGITIKGFQIPKWNELIQFVDEIMAELPQYGYIGWDLALTPQGWCVMEGNYSGEFIFQLINGKGYKKEFEDIIGWKFEKEYWWMEKKGFN